MKPFTLHEQFNVNNRIDPRHPQSFVASLYSFDLRRHAEHGGSGTAGKVAPPDGRATSVSVGRVLRRQRRPRAAVATERVDSRRLHARVGQTRPPVDSGGKDHCKPVVEKTS